MIKAYNLPDFERYLEVFTNSDDEYEYNLIDYALKVVDGGIVSKHIPESMVIRFILMLHDMLYCDEVDEVAVELDYGTFSLLWWNAQEVKHG
jgi:hypothetical protein